MSRKEKYTDMALREAVFSLVMQKDFDKITVTQICERAGVNRATFYLRYNTLEEFYEVLANEWADDIVAGTVRRIEDVGLESTLLTSIMISLENIKAHRRLLPIILKGTSSVLFEKTYALVRAGRLDSSERRFRYRFFIEGVEGVVLQWLEEDCHEEISVLAQRIATIYHILLH